MNSESMKRIKEAAKYEKRAVRALFPERTAEHIEVIERELKSMLFEFAADIIKEELHKKDNLKVKKVEIC